MAFPLSVVIYEPGPGGIPTTNNPRNLSGWIEDFSDSLVLGFGCETMRITGTAHSREEAADWVNRLMSAVEVYTPSGRLRFAGFLNEVILPSFDAAVSLTNMANVLLVRWGDPDGKQGTTPVTNAASIAHYGRKERVLNESISLEADATNRATMILAQIAEPPNKETITAEKEKDGSFAVQLVFVGWAETLKWVTTSSTTETTQAATTQVTGLITAYNLVNAFLDTTAASITATGHAATQFCPPDTTYLERIDKLLSFGDTTQRRIAWGFYSRAITIVVAATSTPDTITYNYSKRAGKLWTTEGNFIEPWDWTPDVMVQNVDVIGPTPASGAIASLTRKYIKRATLRIDKAGVASGALEPDDVDSLAEWVANPVSKSSGITQRHQIAEARIRDAMGSRTIRTDNTNLWDPVIGVLKPGAGGTGKVNTGTIDTGGGDIVFDPGGGTGLTGGGSSPNLAKWSGASSLTNAVSGTDYAPAHAHPYAATVHTHTPAETSGAPDNATYIVQTASSGLSAEQALGALATGILKSTTTTGVVSIAVAGADYSIPGHAHVNTDITNWNEAVDDRVAALLVEGTNITLTYNDASNTLTIAAAGGGTVGGTGTAGRLMQWAAGGANAENSTQIKTGAGVLTLSVASTQTLTISGSSGGTLALGGFTLTLTGSLSSDAGTLDLNSNTLSLASNLTTTGAGDLTLACSATRTLTIPATGTAALGTGATDRLTFWSGTNTLSSDAAIAVDFATNRIVVTGAQSGISCGGGVLVGGNQVVNVRKTGWGAPTGTATRTAFATSTVTLEQLAERLKALIDDLRTTGHGLIGA